MIAHTKNKWGWFLFFGVLMIIAGVAAVALPVIATISVEYLIAWLILFAGVVSVGQAFTVKTWGGFFLKLISGVVYGFAGLLMVVNPLVGVLTLTAILAAMFVAEGVVKVMLGFRLRPGSGWGWFLTGGIVSVLFGFLIFAGLGAASFVLLGTLAGIYLIFDGSAAVFLALSAREQQSDTTSGVEVAG